MELVTNPKIENDQLRNTLFHILAMTEWRYFLSGTSYQSHAENITSTVNSNVIVTESTFIAMQHLNLLKTKKIPQHRIPFIVEQMSQLRRIFILYICE
jgi:hypothetical protein